MYELFEKSFVRDIALSRASSYTDLVKSIHPGLSELFSKFQGASFDNGLYRIMTPGIVEQWEAVVCAAFPEFTRRISCFGYDWLGRVFAIDSQRRESDGCGVALFEPGTGEVLEIPCGINSFHNDELVNYREEAVAASFHSKWLSASGTAPARSQCAGYKKPLFLGGEDVVSNLELIDIDVYWTVSGALIRKTKGLPLGSKVGPIKLTE